MTILSEVCVLPSWVLATDLSIHYSSLNQPDELSSFLQFDHTKDYHIPVTEDFLEHCVDGALSLEVWGHRSAGFAHSQPGWEVDHQLAKARSLADRYPLIAWCITPVSEGGEVIATLFVKDVATARCFQSSP